MTRARLLALVLGACSLGCGHLPPNVVDRSVAIGEPMEKGDIERVPVKGHHVEVLYGVNQCSVEGELVAVTKSSLLVYDEAGILREIPQALLVELELELYPASSSSIYTTTTLGSFSTVSHGYWLVVTLPLWLGVGLPLAAAESRASHVTVNYETIAPLGQYARFPHGEFMNWTGRTEPVTLCGRLGGEVAQARAMLRTSCASPPPPSGPIP